MQPHYELVAGEKGYWQRREEKNFLQVFRFYPFCLVIRTLKTLCFFFESNMRNVSATKKEYLSTSTTNARYIDTHTHTHIYLRHERVRPIVL